ncbi:Pr6Pr family membrane protein [Homoserinimonas hongtaonis]|uniref:Integral membrane protein n=1 Tax=Homoserinimonas hongtaonis TaxID=2079791 RepID=A0A2U1SY39_9MICO|nr:Pr6Pr family membrane protein [Salinibacterium hongtaonis]AWB89096.1 hypothetical protein C2138_05670 [Salinibacterium hongtaonis]PWB96545.1 hypothetical protein DF220_00830 [Salinibacterium hongtaonis]
MPIHTTVLGIARLLTAITGVVALVGDINFTIGTSPLAIGNFFSYFTVESMILAVMVFVWSGIVALTGRRDPLPLDQLRALAVAYVTVSGIVFSVLLIEGTMRGVPVWAPWSSILLHFVIPALALLDWIVAPGRLLPWSTIGWVLVFPAIWVVYTMIRGANVYWYPYFFLDPSLVDVPFELGLYLLAVVVIFASTTTLLIAVSRRRSRARGKPKEKPNATPGQGQQKARGSQEQPA